MSFMNLLCNIEEKIHFNENQDLIHVTPNNPRLTFDSINRVESLKLMHMYELHGLNM